VTRYPGASSKSSPREEDGRRATAGDPERVLRLWQEMRRNRMEPCAATYNKAIQDKAWKGKISAALTWLEEMKLEGMQPDSATYNAVMDACARRRAPGDSAVALQLLEEFDCTFPHHHVESKRDFGGPAAVLQRLDDFRREHGELDTKACAARGSQERVVQLLDRIDSIVDVAIIPRGKIANPERALQMLQDLKNKT